MTTEIFYLPRVDFALREGILHLKLSGILGSAKFWLSLKAPGDTLYSAVIIFKRC